MKWSDAEDVGGFEGGGRLKTESGADGAVSARGRAEADQDHSEAGKIEGIVGGMERLEAELDELQQELAQQGRLATLGMMTAMIAHEFNNILTPTIALAQLALARPEDQELSRRAHQRALDGAQRAGKIASAILGMSRGAAMTEFAEAAGLGASSTGSASSGGVREHKDVVETRACSGEEPAERVLIRGALEQALACMGRDLNRDGIELSVDIPADLGAAIEPVALEHVFLNVLMNARSALLRDPSNQSTDEQHAATKHRADGRSAEGFATERRYERQILVRAWREETDADVAEDSSVKRSEGGVDEECGAWVMVEVSDNGPGMSDAQMERLFKPMALAGQLRGSRADEPMQRVGSGLGMSICRRLVEAAGGSIAVKSVLGEGMVVRVRLRSGR